MFPWRPIPGIELRPSQRPGIIDIYDARTGRLVNNLVLLVSWDDFTGEHYNNSEIQAAPIWIDRDTMGRPIRLRYRMASSETSPASQPASGVQVTVQITYTPRGTVSLGTSVTDNPLHVQNVRIGVGSFFGVQHGTSAARIQARFPITISPTVQGASTGGLGAFSRYNFSRGVILQSAYSDTPTVNISYRGPGYARTDIEQRSTVWEPAHLPMRDRYFQATGNASWIEAGIVYAPAGAAQFEVGLSAAP